MSRARRTFRKSDVTCAIEGAVAAGMRVTRAEIHPVTGNIVVYFGRDDAAAGDEASGALDEWMARRAS